MAFHYKYEAIRLVVLLFLLCSVYLLAIHLNRKYNLNILSKKKYHVYLIIILCLTLVTSSGMRLFMISNNFFTMIFKGEKIYEEVSKNGIDEIKSYNLASEISRGQILYNPGEILATGKIKKGITKLPINLHGENKSLLVLATLKQDATLTWNVKAVEAIK